MSAAHASDLRPDENRFAAPRIGGSVRDVTLKLEAAAADVKPEKSRFLTLLLFFSDSGSGNDSSDLTGLWPLDRNIDRKLVQNPVFLLLMLLDRLIVGSAA